MNYTKIAPPGTFISDYMEYMSEVETSSAYDFWCAIWAMGVGIGRNLYIDRPRAPVYFNWYIILAAESGITRKSTAVRSAINLINRCPEINLITAKTTPTGFVEDLAERGAVSGTSDAHLAFTEMVSILGREGYMRTMPGILTDLYDCPDERQGPGTFSHRLNFKNVYVSFLSASTPTWLATDINPSVIEGGFTSRVIFVVDERPKRLIAWPKKEEAYEGEKVYNSFRRAMDVRRNGPIKINPAGLAAFSRWYRTRDLHTDAFRTSFESREDDHILRLAGCLCINDGTYEIQRKHITRATDTINETKDKANLIFGGNNIEIAKLGMSIDRVRNHLVKASLDGIAHNKLYQAVRQVIPARDFRLLMKIMHEAGLVAKFEVTHKAGKTGILYRANRSIEGVGVTSKILSLLHHSADSV